MTIHHRQLGLALLVSMLLHGFLLSEIRLRTPAAAEPVQALFLELGSVSSGVVPTPAPVVPAPAVPQRATQDSRQPHASAPVKPPSRKTGIPGGLMTPQQTGEAATSEDLRSKSLQMARREVVDPFAGQRVRALSSQTRDSVFGPYEEAYRQKVEQVGRVNYPPPVDGRPLYGTVRVTATIRQDGSLALIEIRQPSGSPNLDDAARRIIQMAAPFQPFTEAMRAETDLVSITRSFNFVRAGETINLK